MNSLEPGSECNINHEDATATETSMVDRGRAVTTAPGDDITRSYHATAIPARLQQCKCLCEDANQLGKQTQTLCSQPVHSCLDHTYTTCWEPKTFDFYHYKVYAF